MGPASPLEAITVWEQARQSASDGECPAWCTLRRNSRRGTADRSKASTLVNPHHHRSDRMGLSARRPALMFAVKSSDAVSRLRLSPNANKKQSDAHGRRQRLKTPVNRLSCAGWLPHDQLPRIAEPGKDANLCHDRYGVDQSNAPHRLDCSRTSM